MAAGSPRAQLNWASAVCGGIAEATSVAVVMHCECKGGEREQQQQEQTLDLETSYLLSLLNQTVGVYLILNG